MSQSFYHKTICFQFIFLKCKYFFENIKIKILINLHIFYHLQLGKNKLLKELM